MFRSRVGPSRPGHPNTDTVPLIPAAHPATGEDGSDPVFVDSSGRRGRRIRRVAYTAAALCAAYTGVLALSFMGATPFAPRTVLPVPGLPSDKPGTVTETPRGDLPAESVAPSSGGVSVSPSALPGPTALPTDPPSGGSPSAPATGPVTSPAPTASSSPTGSSPTTGPTGSGSPSGTGPTASGGTSTATSGSSGGTPSGSPDDGESPGISTVPAGT
ncbi:hypothetical protein [Streptomyces sp. STR69]|uniref:hypothetical protein n=1 Tax=Streptomyces sp. STR69 TaxID=1796942 RepID=UPI0021C9B4A0|nr:hypothetical protein [Streptomyces sp. STR69]